MSAEILIVRPRTTPVVYTFDGALSAVLKMATLSSRRKKVSKTWPQVGLSVRSWS